MPYSYSTLIIMGGLAAIAVGLVYLIRYVYKLEKPSPGNCDYVKSSNPDVKWSNDCSYIQELLLSNNIQTPTERLYLTKFTSSPSLGQPWGVNVWYKYKYVNSKTGEYGKASPWTSSPITAGSANLPCLSGNCSNMQYSGKDSCRSNLPELQVNTLQYPIGSDYYANVHRYVAPIGSPPPTDSTDGKIVGMLYPNGSGAGIFIDTSPSPCKETTCGNIQGC